MAPQESVLTGEYSSLAVSSPVLVSLITKGKIIRNLVHELKCLSECLQSLVSFNSSFSFNRSSFLLGDGTVNEFITFQFILNLDSQLGYFTDSPKLSVEPLPSPILLFSRMYWAVWNWDQGTL